MSPQRVIEFSEKTQVKFSYVVLVALITALVTLTAAAYGARDTMLQSVRTERTEVLKAYVTHEEFLQWQLRESDKRDRQFRALLGRLDEIRKR